MDTCQQGLWRYELTFLLENVRIGLSQIEEGEMKRLSHILIMLFLMAVIVSNVLADDTWLCPTCGEEREENFCTNDGTKRPEYWICPTCGNSRSESDNFCIEDETAKPDSSITGNEISFDNVSVGDTITFGTYEQDNDTSNGPEAIEWSVLDVQDGRALIISKYGLDAKPYNEEYTEITWESCTLRSWLNNDFLNEAFSSGEQAMIPTVTVTADKNPEFDTDPGNDTQDKIFLLSFSEAVKYFSSDEERMCVPTVYAINQGTYMSDSYKVGGAATSWWWLRSPGRNDSSAAFVFHDGDVCCDGRRVDSVLVCVRPALWTTL